MTLSWLHTPSEPRSDSGAASEMYIGDREVNRPAGIPAASGTPARGSDGVTRPRGAGYGDTPPAPRITRSRPLAAEGLKH